jgi:translocator protein
MNWKKITGFSGWIALCYATAAVGSLAPTRWYAELVRPSWAPPGWLFAPVWTLLYGMMGVAAALVWSRGGFSANRAPLGLFLVQLVLNGAWTFIFFGQRALGWAAVEIAVLWVLILATLVAFWRRRGSAGILLIPYLLWVGFACALTFEIWRLN